MMRIVLTRSFAAVAAAALIASGCGQTNESSRPTVKPSRFAAGRALVVFRAQHYASQLVLPASKWRSSILPRSHKDIAREAYERATKGVLRRPHAA